jgi:hypothetical protein
LRRKSDSFASLLGGSFPECLLLQKAKMATPEVCAS